MSSYTKNSFKRRLLVTGAILLLLVSVVTVSLFMATRQYSSYLERSAHASRVYASYLAVSDHTYRKLNAMGQTVEEKTLTNLEARYRNQRALQDALKAVRENITTDITDTGDVKESAELKHFNEIELLAQEIIRGSEAVRSAVTSNDSVLAKSELERLRSSEIEGQFTRMIDEALVEEIREVSETEQVARELNTLLTTLLPLVLVFCVLLASILFYATWQALTRSLKIFENAASSYQLGDFNYRIPGEVEREFESLATALNHMASEVATQRDRERTTQENLESLIESRTRELKNTNEKLETIIETRKQFLADISHELRTPLTIIQGESDIALRGETKTHEQYVEALTRVREQSIHTTRLVQDLLFIARAEGGKAPLHKRSVAVVPMVIEICEDFGVIAAEKNIVIIKNCLWPDLVANVDSGRFKQVITILLDNAIRYSHKDAKIEVTVSAKENNVLIAVTDSGIGLKYNEVNQVFSRFYRGHDGEGNASGTGLGLPVAKAIVDAHNGTITLQGQEDVGTTATVSLPLETSLRAVR